MGASSITGQIITHLRPAKGHTQPTRPGYPTRASRPFHLVHGRHQRGAAAPPPLSEGAPKPDMITTRVRTLQPLPAGLRTESRAPSRCKNHSFGGCAPDLLAATIDPTLSRPPLSPLQGKADGFSSFVSDLYASPMPRGGRPLRWRSWAAPSGAGSRPL
jgi:hypothetical protein